MPEDDDVLTRPPRESGPSLKVPGVVLLLLAAAWQGHLALFAVQSLQPMRQMYQDLGAQLPLVTRALLAWGRVLVVLPVCSLGAAAWVATRRQPSGRAVLWIFAVAVAATFALDAVFRVAAYAPMLRLIEQLR